MIRVAVELVGAKGAQTIQITGGENEKSGWGDYNGYENKVFCKLSTGRIHNPIVTGDFKRICIPAL